MRFGEDDMVVGRTLWDFILEIFGMPGFTTVIIALIILLEIILILVLLLVHAGLLDLKLSYGGSSLELHQFVSLARTSV
ncbi:MAG TPA: hypothetical protein PKY93_06600 [Methanothrix sp.]|nr:hypothetical protein [Methanothrix sp.]HPC89981.1 hypothetical protein [Methanothrix sp.]HQI68198.1 hypothetical protein [Methanothrix sp.]HRT17853.1 hypothetical protein [Methanothrix sp.]